MGFGSFDFICQQAALPLCALVGSKNGIEPICYARNVELANTLIFQAGTLHQFELRLTKPPILFTLRHSS